MSIKQLWAPWRADYIYTNTKRNEPESGHCIFCREFSREDDRKGLVLFRGDIIGIMMNKFPYNNGHLMVYPWRHTGNVEDLKHEEAAELFRLIKESAAILKNEMKAEGFNIGANIGKVAGAGIEEHIHFHIVPRWNGDTNFMPAIGEIKVIPEHIRTTYDKLYPHFQRLLTLR